MPPNRPYYDFLVQRLGLDRANAIYGDEAQEVEQRQPTSTGEAARNQQYSVDIAKRSMELGGGQYGSAMAALLYGGQPEKSYSQWFKGHLTGTEGGGFGNLPMVPSGRSREGLRNALADVLEIAPQNIESIVEDVETKITGAGRPPFDEGPLTEAQERHEEIPEEFRPAAFAGRTAARFYGGIAGFLTSVPGMFVAPERGLEKELEPGESAGSARLAQEFQGLKELLGSPLAAVDWIIQHHLQGKDPEQIAKAIQPNMPLSRLYQAITGHEMNPMRYRQVINDLYAAPEMPLFGKSIGKQIIKGGVKVGGKVGRKVGLVARPEPGIAEQAARKPLPTAEELYADLTKNVRLELETERRAMSAVEGLMEHMPSQEEILGRKLEMLDKAEITSGRATEGFSRADRLLPLIGLGIVSASAVDALLDAEDNPPDLRVSASSDIRIAPTLTAGAMILGRKGLTKRRSRAPMFHSTSIRKLESRFSPKKLIPVEEFDKVMETMERKGEITKEEARLLNFDDLRIEGLKRATEENKLGSIDPAELKAHLERYDIQVEEVTLKGVVAEYERYATKGGKNYRELLFKMPEGPETAEFKAYTTMLKERVRQRIIKFQKTNPPPANELFVRRSIEDQDYFISIHSREFLEPSERSLLRTKKDAARAAEYDAPHFGDYSKNLLAHTRLSDFQDAKGKKTLLIEEIQSDLHQESVRRGYLGEEKQPTPAEMEAPLEVRAQLIEIEQASEAIKQRLRELGQGAAGGEVMRGTGRTLQESRDAQLRQSFGVKPPSPQEMMANAAKEVQIRTLQDQLKQLDIEATTLEAELPRLTDRAQPRFGEGGPAEAPFRKNWHEWVMKRVLRLAAEEGYNQIAWTTGRSQIARYRLAAGGLAARLVYQPKHGLLQASSRNGGVLLYRDGFTRTDVRRELGPKIADQLLDMESFNQDYYNSQGIVQFDIDGSRMGEIRLEGTQAQGMLSFYDQVLPSFMAKYGKAFETAPVKDELFADLKRLEEPTAIYGPGGRRLPDVKAWTFKIPKQLKDAVLFKGQPKYGRTLVATGVAALTAQILSPDDQGDQFSLAAVALAGLEKRGLGRKKGGLLVARDMAARGALMFKDGIVDRGEWTKQMTQEYGKDFEPVAERTYKQAQRAFHGAISKVVRKEWPDDSRIMGYFHAGSEFKPWYETDTHKFFRIFGTDRGLAIDIAAILSAKKSMEVNTNLLLEKYSEYKTTGTIRGGKGTKISENQAKKIALAIDGKTWADPKSPYYKVMRFADALKGDPTAVVVDVHVAKIFNVKKTEKGEYDVSGPLYLMIEKTIQDMAAAEGTTAARFQEALWQGLKFEERTTGSAASFAPRLDYSAEQYLSNEVLAKMDTKWAKQLLQLRKEGLPDQARWQLKHYSHKPLWSVDPQRQGTGIFTGEERLRAREKRFPARAYYEIMRTDFDPTRTTTRGKVKIDIKSQGITPYDEVRFKGGMVPYYDRSGKRRMRYKKPLQYQYTVDAKLRLYDIIRDPEGVASKAKGDVTSFESKVSRKWDGYFDRDKGVAVVFREMVPGAAYEGSLKLYGVAAPLAAISVGYLFSELDERDQNSLLSGMPDAIMIGMFGFNRKGLDAARKRLGLDAMPKASRVKWTENLVEAARANMHMRAEELAADILSSGRPASATEQAAIGLRIAQKLDDHAALMEQRAKATEAGRTVDAADYRIQEMKEEEIIDDLTKGMMAGRSEAARATAFGRAQMDLDKFTLVGMRRDATNLKQRRLSPEEALEFERFAEEHARLTEENAKLRAEHDELATAREKANAAKVAAYESRKRTAELKTKSGRARLDAEEGDILAQLNEIGFRTNDITGVTAEGAFLIGKLALNYVKRGVTDMEALVEKVRNRVPDISEGDVYRSLIAKDPKVQAKAQKQASKDLAHLRKQARLLTKILNARAGIFDKPKAKAPTAPEIKVLQDELAELRQGLFRQKMEQRQMEHALRRIDQLQDMLANHYRAVKKKQRIPPEDLIPLREEIKKLERDMRIGDNISDLREQLRTGDIKVKPGPERERLPGPLIKNEVELKMLRRQVRARQLDMAPLTPVTKYLEAVNTLRTMKATADMSAVLRQGLVLSVKRPKQAGRALIGATKAFFSEYSADQIDFYLRNAPHHWVREGAGVHFSELGGAPMVREEYFSSRLAERIPVWGSVVKASERHMTTYLNMIRASAFDEFYFKHPNATTAELKAWANFVNVASGRGDLGALGRAGKFMGGVFFAPRFAASRVQTPYMLYKHWEHPRVRAMIAKDLAATAGVGLTTLYLAHLAGADVGLDPREADFGKIVVGNTKFDVWGGMQQPYRLITRIFMIGTDRAGFTGKHLTEAEKGIRPIDLVGRFLGYKLSPGITLGQELLTGESMVGEERTLTESMARSVLPLVAEDVWEAHNQGGAGMGAAAGGAAFFGVGANTYPDSESRVRRDIKKSIMAGDFKGAVERQREWNTKNPDDQIAKDGLGTSALKSIERKIRKELKAGDRSAAIKAARKHNKIWKGRESREGESFEITERRFEQIEENAKKAQRKAEREATRGRK